MPPSDFLFSSLPAERFKPLFALDDAALRERRIRRITADGPGYLCRVALDHVPTGADLLLLSYTHHAAESPYRASGPVFVGEGAVRAQPAVGQVPAAMRGRLFSIRAYGPQGDIVDSDVAQGSVIESAVMRLLSVAGVRMLHLHHARHGCYACRVDPVP